MEGVLTGRKVDKKSVLRKKWSGEAWERLRRGGEEEKKCGRSFDWEKSS